MKPVFKSFVDEEEITAPKSGWTPIQQQTVIEDFNKDKKYSFKTLKEVLVESGLAKEKKEPKVDQSLEPILEAIKEVFVEKTEPQVITETIIEEKIEEPIVEEKVEVVNEKSLIDKASEYIKRRVKIEEADSFQQPVAPNIPNNLGDINKRVRYLEQWLSKVSMAGPGSGEVNFRYLDDVDRSTMTNSNDNWILEYNSSSGNVQFTNQLGPVDLIRFDLTHTHEEERVEGTLCWDPNDGTLNLAHGSNVVQQVGQEQYYRVRNKTGNTITNGTCLRFSGAEMNGTARILAEPFLADGTFPNLYVIGIATQDIEDGEDGFATSFGKVRDLDTTGNTVSEVWAVGDILYANPNIAGALTKIKPTAPNNVNPLAALLRVDATEGEIFVRPTFEQQQRYGKFIKTNDQIPGNIDYGWPVSFTSATISNGVSLGTPNSTIVVSESGLYQFDASIQFTSGNSSKKDARVWFRKNGVDVPNSTRILTNDIGDGFSTLQLVQSFSLEANDNVAIVFAVTNTGLYMHAAANTAYAPAAPAVLLSVTQVQL